jgi:SprT protein
MSREQIASVLSKYLPAAAVPVCSAWIINKNIHLKITRGRASKFGDYKPLPKGKGHHISVNHDLNPFAFLITFIHEVAHLHCFINHKRRHEPHGIEWKNEFRNLLTNFILMKIFPENIETALLKYLKDPAASSCRDKDLMRALRQYDTREEQVFHLEDLPENSVFTLHQSKSGLVFKKGNKIRTRYHCLEINTNRAYYVGPMAEVVTAEL